MERYIDKETGEVFEENVNDVLRKETLKYIRSDDNEKYSYNDDKTKIKESIKKYKENRSFISQRIFLSYIKEVIK